MLCIIVVYIINTYITHYNTVNTDKGTRLFSNRIPAESHVGISNNILKWWSAIGKLYIVQFNDIQKYVSLKRYKKYPISINTVILEIILLNYLKLNTEHFQI